MKYVFMLYALDIETIDVFVFIYSQTLQILVLNKIYILRTTYFGMEGVLTYAC
jgi:hypothetical protein